ncbi:hypothetical protein F0U60_47520 [Archangium minus]|uniref:Lipoprotein n=1 Tax=Archangium minus TaxID=83450 RepID=A0ABY9X6B9_9BACT|nr:hypothetical protein F0U60_47520 [Archangium minus]
MKSPGALVVFLSLLTMACGGPVNEAGNPDVPGSLRAELDAGDSVIGSWANGGWVQTIDATGNGYMSKVASGYPCWSVGAQSFRNLVKSSSNPNVYSGECGICQGTTIVWVPVSITVSTDGKWMTEYFNGTSSSWYRI